MKPTTKHTHAVVFGRKVDGCPRCAELLAGAPAVKWNIKAPRSTKATHSCEASGCNKVCCTFGDW